jgi:hypothetical protein
VQTANHHSDHPAELAAQQLRAAEIARASIVKRNNAITAILTGAGLAIISAYLLAGSGHPPLSIAGVIVTFIFGVIAGFMYANGFEYVLHRFFLHWGDGFLVQRHALHHDSAGAPDEARYVNFATSPWVVVLVFALNAPAVFALAYFLRASNLIYPGFVPGIFAGFTCYFVAYEEIHWRIHFGGWLPRWLRFARRHHMLHHAGREGRHNVFLPVFDWIFQRHEWK